MSFFRIDAVESVGHQRACRVVQFRRELDSGRAGADDRDLQLLRPQRPRLRMGADARVDQPPMEPLRLDRRLEWDRVLRYARGAEVVG